MAKTVLNREDTELNMNPFATWGSRMAINPAPATVSRRAISSRKLRPIPDPEGICQPAAGCGARSHPWIK